MSKSFKDMREKSIVDETNMKTKSKYSKVEKIRFAFKCGAKELKIIVNGKTVDTEHLETKKSIHN